MSSEKRWGAFFIAACVLVVITSSLWSVDPDVFWHLKVGEWILEHLAIPRADIYSWSAYGKPWTAHQWFWEVIIYVVYKYAGILGLWSVVFLSGTAVGLLIKHGLENRGVSPVTAAACGGLAVVLLGGWLKPWPQAGVYVMFAVYLLLSVKGEWTRKETAWATAAAVLWANIHTSAVMFPLLLFAETFWFFVTEKRLDKKRLVTVFTTGLATLFNPHGAGLWVYAVREGLMAPEYRTNISEWLPYFFTSDAAAVFLISAVILFYAVYRKNVGLDFARAAGFWTLALFSRIYTPYAVMSTAVVLGTMDFRLRVKSLKHLSVACLALGIIIPAVKCVPVDLEAAALGDYPIAAVNVIHKQGIKRVFNDYGWGGYLIWEGVPVYIDGRADLYAYKDIFKNYMNLKESRDIGNAVEETGADSALVKSHGLFDHALRHAPGWKEIFRDDVCVLYKRVEKH